MENDLGVTKDYHHTVTPNGLKALAENRAATQFGGDRANPHFTQTDKAKPHTYRNAARYMAAQEIDKDSQFDALNLLPKKTSAASFIVAKAMNRAAMADMRAVEYLTEQVDGKVPQENIIRTGEPAVFDDNTSKEELDAMWREKIGT